jgi:uncharacterized protein with FMN-binding domain
MNNKKTIISIAAVVVVAAGVYGVAAMSKKSSATETAVMPATAEQTPTPVTPTTTTPVADKPASAATSTYKDGTYTATGAYRSPGGPDNIGVTVTLKNDVVASVSIVPMPHDPTSTHYQGLFASGYQQLVLGKDIDSVHLDAVSGSSLTPIGFNDAITQIKAKAKA